MKLDKIKFARLIAYVSKFGAVLDDYDIEAVDNICDIDIPESVISKASCVEVDNLLMLMNEGTRKIEAIKAYRTLTGAGLKESKDAVEKYWQSKGHYIPDEKKPASEPATLGDILHSAGRNKAGNDISGI